MRPVRLGVLATLEKLLDTLELDEAGETRAAIARAVAGKLDEAASSEMRAGPDPTSSLSKELRDVVNEILEDSADDDDFVADLFSPVGNSQN